MKYPGSIPLRDFHGFISNSCWADFTASCIVTCALLSDDSSDAAACVPRERTNCAIFRIRLHVKALRTLRSHGWPLAVLRTSHNTSSNKIEFRLREHWSPSVVWQNLSLIIAPVCRLFVSKRLAVYPEVH